MKTYHYLQAWLLSFYSAKFYKDVGQHWRGVGFCYLLFLLLVCLGIFCLVQQKMVKNFIQQVGMPIAMQLPEIQLSQGRLQLKPDVPHVIKNPRNEQRLVVMDPTGTFKDLQQADALILITQDSYIYADQTQQQRVKPLSSIPDFSLSQAQISQWLKIISSTSFWGIAYLVYVLGYLFGYALLILASSLFALICAKQLAITLSYLSLIRLTTVAYTPIILTNLLGSIFKISIPYSALVYLFLMVFYIYYAVRANKSPEQSSVVGI